MADEDVTNPAPTDQGQPAPEAGNTPPAEGQPAPETGNTPPAEGQPAAGANPLPSPLDEPDPQPQQDPAKSAAPEKYEDFSLGDEYGTVTEAEAEVFAQAARELGLSQENAQKIVGSMAPVMVKKLNDRLQGYTAQWQKASQEDPEIGGANYQANLGVAKIAYQKFATPELKQMLQQSGLGTNPEILRLFYRVGKTLQQDQGVKAGQAPAAKPFNKYPNTPGMVYNK